MTTIAHAFTEVTAEQTTTSSTYGAVSGATITSGNFTAGKKYLIVVKANQYVLDSFTEKCKLRVVHGATAFAESESIYNSFSGGAQDWSMTYFWFTVWTAVSSEAITLEMAATGGKTGACNFISLFAMNLSDDVTEDTDWFFAEDGTDSALSGTPLAGAALSFTPSNADHDWLVLAYAQFDNSGGDLIGAVTQIDATGTYTSSTPQAIVYTSSTSNSSVGYARVYEALAASAQTFTEKSSETTTDRSRLHSAMFALDLNLFANHATDYVASVGTPSATDYATLAATASITPDNAGDVWMGACVIYDKAAANREGEIRLQVDNSDQPAGQTTDNRQFSASNTSGAQENYTLSTLVSSMTAASHTIDVDVSADAAGGTMIDASLWAITMELAAAAGTPHGLGTTDLALTGIATLTGDIGLTLVARSWVMPSTAPESTAGYMRVYSGTGASRTIIDQGAVTADASGNFVLSCTDQGTALGTKAFAEVDDWDGDTGTVSIDGGPGIVTVTAD